MLFATVSWQQTILWGSWSASDSRGIISLSAKRKLVILMVQVNLPRLTVIIKQINSKSSSTFVPYHKTRKSGSDFKFMAAMLIFMVKCLWFSGFCAPIFYIFGTATEKDRGRHIYVLMDGQLLFLKHPNKLFEVKLWTLLFFNLFYFLEVFATVYVFHN